MTNPNAAYRRLPGWQFLVTGHSVHLADDHMLYVVTQLFTERCRRFYFRDIQTITTTRTLRYAVANGACLVLAFFLCLGSIMGPADAAMVFRVLAAVFLVAAVANAALGPSCVCRIHTAVQTEELRCLRRLRTARKVAAMLRPMIEAAQGTLSPEALEKEEGDLIVSAPSPRALNQPVETGDIRHEDGRFHGWLFGLVLLAALLHVVDLTYPNTFNDFLELTLAAAMSIFIILALRRQHSSDLPVSVCAITWAAMAEIVAAFTFIQFATVFGVIIESPDKASIELMRYRHLGGPVVNVFYGVAAMVYAVTGMLGLMELRRFRAEYAEFSASPVAQPDAEPAAQDEGAPDA